ncbi:MAG: RsmB/NOP family class I SAM-dependent RNA methyltransferase [Bacteriovoracaceae bacterium]|nr:RsmB/NOP family class I SAM-dependent RNA methyltransferase [Bacteriovoracaceae bacterium]
MTFSIKDVENKIPAEALTFFKQNFSAGELRSILEAMRLPRISSFRLNALKGNRSELLTLLKKDNIKFQEIAGIENAFELKSKEKDFLKSQAYKEGRVYLQGLSGILPVQFLKPKQGEKILDVAAAPGSKTTLMSAMMQNTGEIHALDPDYVRLERLKFNSNILGVTNIEFFKTQAEKFKCEDSEVYDAILADVPCSGEGRFNLYDAKSYLSWKAKEQEKFQRLQLKIMRNALRLLKSGGRLMYSTCTLNQLENEQVILELLKEDHTLTCENIFHFSPWYPEFKKIEQGGLRALKIIPSERFEGFFMCLLKKNR